MDKGHDAVALGRELAGRDMASAPYSSAGILSETMTPASWTPDDLNKPLERIKQSMNVLKRRIGCMTGTFDAAGKALGQPFRDGVSADGSSLLGAKMVPGCDILIDVHWRALEDLVYAGEVRVHRRLEFHKATNSKGCSALAESDLLSLWLESHP